MGNRTKLLGVFANCTQIDCLKLLEIEHGVKTCKVTRRYAGVLCSLKS